MTPFYQDSSVTLFHGNAFDIVPQLDPVDHVIVDTPYSERTHKGHNQVEGIHGRRGISYEPWDPEKVKALVEVAHPKCRGWFVTMTDHVLAYDWERCLQLTGRYVFPPLPFVSRGSRFRMAGDGPASWTVWIIVARPKTREFCGWGSLPGSYILPEGAGKTYPIVGGKPPYLMHALVADYSKHGDLILDPCMGAGTTVVEAKRLGRRALGIDSEERCCELAAKWAEKTASQLSIGLRTIKGKQAALNLQSDDNEVKSHS